MEIRHPNNNEIISEIKQMKTARKPIEPLENPFGYMSIEEIKAIMETMFVIEDEYFEENNFELNYSYDARDAWSGKIHEIRD